MSEGYSADLCDGWGGDCKAACIYWEDEFLRKYADGPCWGELHVDDAEDGDGGYSWVHYCDGHEARYNEGGAYVPNPKMTDAMKAEQE